MYYDSQIYIDFVHDVWQYSWVNVQQPTRMGSTAGIINIREVIVDLYITCT